LTNPGDETILTPMLLFGGSFDPIHHGHLIVSRHIAEALGVHDVTVIPSATPPHKRSRRLTSADERQEMCREAIEGEAQFALCDWELRQTGPNYTLRTIAHFREKLGDGAPLYWLIGTDSLRELHTWYHAAELVDACTLVTAPRPGSEIPSRSELERHFSAGQARKLLEHVIEGPRIDISGTDIRARVRRGESIRYLVPDAVAEYIASRGLYRD